MNAYTDTARTEQPLYRGTDSSPPQKQVTGGPRLFGALTSALANVDETFPAVTSIRLSASVRLFSVFAAAYIMLQDYLVRQWPLGIPGIPLILLIFFMIYVGARYWRAVRDSTSQEPLSIYWVDTLWYLAFTGMTDGPGNHFALFLPFPVIFASLRWGFAAGMTMAAFSATVLCLFGVLNVSTGTAVLGPDVFLPPVALLVLGYLIATWANSGLALSRRLASLKEMNSLFNPRFDIEQILDQVVRQIATLYPLNSYALVLGKNGNPPLVFRANLPDRMYRVADATAVDLANVLSSVVTNGAMIYCGSQNLQHADIYCSSTAAATKKYATTAAAVAARLDCTEFCSVQFNLRHGVTAQLFVCAEKSCFGAEDLPFFAQLCEQLSPRIENVQLVDCLCNEVAEQERKKISRDLHDSAIQPYIGLKFALEALVRKVSPDDPLAKDIGHLAEMTNTQITELRRYVKGLHGHGEPEHAALVPAVRRQAARFGDLYGIKINVVATEELRVSDTLANEAFHLVSEALSNIRRHTAAPVANIHMSCTPEKFILQVTNPCDAATATKPFTPLSISERALALGGDYQVQSGPGRDTIVTVEIPMYIGGRGHASQ